MWHSAGQATSCCRQGASADVEKVPAVPRAVSAQLGDCCLPCYVTLLGAKFMLYEVGGQHADKILTAAGRRPV